MGLERDGHVVSAIQNMHINNTLTLHLGLVVFDKVVVMYQPGISGLASADIYTPVEANDDETPLSEKSGRTTVNQY
jgi:hypothetical protein